MINELAFLREFTMGSVIVRLLLAEIAFGKIGLKIKHQPDYHVEILYNEKNSLDDVLRYCKDNRMDIVNLRIHSNEKGATAAYTAEVHLRGKFQSDQMVDHIQRKPGIISAIGI